MREVPRHWRDGAIDDVALVDASGVWNRPAFVHVAEQRCRQAALEGFAVTLAYVRVGEVDSNGTVCAMNEALLHDFAGALTAASRWGDTVGRVAQNDFAMLVGDTSDAGISGIVRLIHASVERSSRTSGTQLRVHVGVASFIPDGKPRIVELLDYAVARVIEHEASQREHVPADCPRCCFVLDDPTALASVNLDIPPGQVALTEREQQVLRLLAAHRPYTEIGRSLFISVNTVKSHASHIYAKLGARTSREAVGRARAAGLLAPERPTRDMAGASDRPRDEVQPRDLPEDALDAEMDHDRAELERISLIAQGLTAAIDPDDILEIIVTQGLGSLDADRAIVALRVQDMLVPLASHGYRRELIDEMLPLALSTDRPMTLAVRDATTIWVPDREDAERRFPELGESTSAESQAWIATPLVIEARSFGVLAVDFLEPHEFDARELEYVSALGAICVLAFQREHGAPANLVRRSVLEALGEHDDQPTISVEPRGKEWVVVDHDGVASIHPTRVEALRAASWLQATRHAGPWSRSHGRGR